MNSKLPVIFHRYRKKKFTTKRDNYKNYTDAKWTWNEIYLEVRDEKKTNKNALCDIAIKYNIKYSTLKERYRKWIYNDCEVVNNNETRGGSKKIFTEEEEKELSNYIKELYIKNVFIFDNDYLKIVAL